MKNLKMKAVYNQLHESYAAQFIVVAFANFTTLLPAFKPVLI